jgi:hypothetical protein
VRRDRHSKGTLTCRLGIIQVLAPNRPGRLAASVRADAANGSQTHAVAATPYREVLVRHLVSALGLIIYLLGQSCWAGSTVRCRAWTPIAGSGGEDGTFSWGALGPDVAGRLVGSGARAKVRRRAGCWLCALFVACGAGDCRYWRRCADMVFGAMVDRPHHRLFGDAWSDCPRPWIPLRGARGGDCDRCPAWHCAEAL